MLGYWTVAAVALLYIFFDVNYFLRIIFTVGWGRLFQTRRKILTPTTIYGICLTQDIDLVFRHMNNARYLRELDFARFHYYDRSGLFSAISVKGGGMVQGACSTRYRRPLLIFTPYKITSQLIYWDEKNFYLEHQIISLPDNFIRAVVLSKQSVTGLKVPVQDIVSQVDPTARRPELPNDLKLWLDSLTQSSEKLKKKA